MLQNTVTFDKKPTDIWY